MLPISAYQLCFLNSLYLSEYKKKNGLLQALVLHLVKSNRKKGA